MFKFLRPHRNPKAREEKEKEVEHVETVHHELKNEAENLLDELQHTLRHGPQVDRHIRRFQESLRDRARDHIRDTIRDAERDRIRDVDRDRIHDATKPSDDEESK
jgi:hypothetical protein